MWDYSLFAPCLTLAGVLTSRLAGAGALTSRLIRAGTLYIATFYDFEKNMTLAFTFTLSAKKYICSSKDS